MKALLLSTFAWVALAPGLAPAAEVDLPPFYASVVALPAEGKPGTVIAREEVATQVPGAVAWRIAFLSSDVGGNPTKSTALVVAPKGAASPDGRPILVWAHGTTGTAQNCGPSQVLNPAQDLNEYFLVGGTSWTDFGIPGLTDLIAAGYAVVAPDYQGLGGGGTHQYAVAATQGRDAINAARAVGAMGLSGGATKAAVYGWSQGGGAVLGAASLADDIARTGTAFDGLQFVGFGAMAPQDVAVLIPPDALTEDGAAKVLPALAQKFSDNVFNFTHYAMSMWAMTAAFPDLKLTDIFTEEGAKVVNQVFSQKCMHAGADTLDFAYGETFKTLLNPQPTNGLAWVRALVAGSVAPVKPVAPVVIYWGTADTVIDPEMGKLYQAQMCGMGADVTRVQLPGAQSHFTTPGAATPLVLAWLNDRFAGTPSENGCPAN